MAAQQVSIVSQHYRMSGGTSVCLASAPNIVPSIVPIIPGIVITSPQWVRI